MVITIISYLFGITQIQKKVSEQVNTENPQFLKIIDPEKGHVKMNSFKTGTKILFQITKKTKSKIFTFGGLLRQNIYILGGLYNKFPIYN